MKTHQYILITAILFVILFYEQEPGLNLGILAVVYTVLTLFRTSEKTEPGHFSFFL